MNRNPLRLDNLLHTVLIIATGAMLAFPAAEARSDTDCVAAGSTGPVLATDVQPLSAPETSIRGARR